MECGCPNNNNIYCYLYFATWDFIKKKLTENKVELRKYDNQLINYLFYYIKIMIKSKQRSRDDFCRWINFSGFTLRRLQQMVHHSIVVFKHDHTKDQKTVDLQSSLKFVFSRSALDFVQ